MSLTSKRLLFWTPRLITIALALFLSLFALDVLGERLASWRMGLAFLIHLTPVLVLVLILLLAWRWPWVGATGFTAMGLSYAWFLARRADRFHWDWFAVVAGPMFLVGALFVANWLWRRELHEAHLV